VSSAQCASQKLTRDDKNLLQDERLAYREVILANTFQSLGVVLDAMEMMGLKLEDTENVKEMAVIADIGSFPEVRPHALPQYCADVSVSSSKHVSCSSGLFPLMSQAL
jgi:hypothetical protein